MHFDRIHYMNGLSQNKLVGDPALDASSDDDLSLQVDILLIHFDLLCIIKILILARCYHRGDADQRGENLFTAFRLIL